MFCTSHDLQIYALAAVMLLIGVIIFAVVLEEYRSAIVKAEEIAGGDNIAIKALKDIFHQWVASIVSLFFKSKINRWVKCFWST